MPFSVDVPLAFGWHVTIFVTWTSLAVMALVAIGAVVGRKLLVASWR